MTPNDLELIRKIIVDAIKASTEDMISLTAAGLAISTLCAAIGALWGWGYKLSRDFATKIEEILKNQQLREDGKETQQEDRINNLLNKKEERHQKDLDRLNERIDRLEKARDMARDQYNHSLKESQSLLSQQLVESTASISEQCQMTDIIIPILKKLSED
jgi:DNA anti-recombination protein RmuC